MSEERIQNITSPQPEEQEIDLIELAQKVWASRKLVFKACGIAALVGLVVAFSIPKEYSTSVTLAPESGGKSGGGSMGALAAMAGINLGTSSGEDALSPELYPDIVRCDNLVCYYAGSFDICFADGYRDALPAELHHRLSD